MEDNLRNLSFRWAETLNLFVRRGDSDRGSCVESINSGGNIRTIDIVQHGGQKGEQIWEIGCNLMSDVQISNEMADVHHSSFTDREVRFSQTLLNSEQAGLERLWR